MRAVNEGLLPLYPVPVYPSRAMESTENRNEGPALNDRVCRASFMGFPWTRGTNSVNRGIRQNPSATTHGEI